MMFGTPIKDWENECSGITTEYYSQTNNSQEDDSIIIFILSLFGGMIFGVFISILGRKIRFTNLQYERIN